eukprot:SM000014S00340  [mRNA]  locus=s14:829958:831464:+ [translate_table: standard]
MGAEHGGVGWRPVPLAVEHLVTLRGASHVSSPCMQRSAAYRGQQAAMAGGTAASAVFTGTAAGAPPATSSSAACQRAAAVHGSRTLLSQAACHGRKLPHAGCGGRGASPNWRRRRRRKSRLAGTARALSWRWEDEDTGGGDVGTGTRGDSGSEKGDGAAFEHGVALFNAGQYYACHDVLEELWHRAAEPQRTALHGVLQCAVGIYHLLNQVVLLHSPLIRSAQHRFNMAPFSALQQRCCILRWLQNHKGAMVELGEGLNKLRRLPSRTGPFHDLEHQASALLEFIYSTQLEHAACADDVCVAMDGSETSYRLLGDFAAGQQLYALHVDVNGLARLRYYPLHARSESSNDFPAQPEQQVLLPILDASEADLRSC